MEVEDLQVLLDELCDAKSSLVTCKGYMQRQWVVGRLPRIPGRVLDVNKDLPIMDPDGRFREHAEMRHRCRRAAIDAESSAKLRRSLV